MGASACSASISLGGEESATPSVSPKASSAPPVPHLDTVPDIQDFWAKTYPEIYDAPYEPIPADQIYAAGTSGVSLPDCGGAPIVDKDWEGNAFYCFGDNEIVYDARLGGLMTELGKQGGPLAVGIVFAHEWGHAIQDRAGNVREPSIYMELQADCFAGSWLKHVGEEGSADLQFEEEDLDRLLGVLLSFRDTPGSHAGSATAHGSGFDRITSFQDGFEGGAQACVDYFTDPPFITEIPFSSLQERRTGGNAPAKTVIPATVELLNDFYTKTDRRIYEPIPTRRVFTFDPTDPKAVTADALPECDGAAMDPAELTNEVFICEPDGYVIVDVNYLQRIYEEVGDFGVATIVAMPWAQYVQHLQGYPASADSTTASARASGCYTGGFTAAMVNSFLVSKTLGRVELSAGDLDEAISAFLDEDGTDGPQGDSAFQRVQAFQDGFFKGYRRCKVYLADLPGSAPTTAPSRAISPSS